MFRLTSAALRCFLLALVAAAVLPGSASAQAVTGTMSGTVVDPQGRVIPGATAFAVMPYLPSSVASARVNPTTPPLAAR